MQFWIIICNQIIDLVRKSDDIYFWVFRIYSTVTSILLLLAHKLIDKPIQPCLQKTKYPLPFHTLTSLHSFNNGHQVFRGPHIDALSVDPHPVTWASWVCTSPPQNKAHTDTVWYPSPVAFIFPSFKSEMSTNVHYWNHVQTNKCPSQTAEREMTGALEQEHIQSLFGSSRGQFK